MAPVDIDSLPPVEYLVMDVLAARARLGETCWTFPSRLRPAMRSLADRGLLWWQPGNLPHTIRAFLTGEGRGAVLYEGYTDPVMTARRAIAEQLKVLADRWQRQSTTGYDATAQCARELQRLLEEKLLGEEGT